ncbi:MAG: hypothetical protein CMJ78_14970 [Planctomycetaceae bacterium]|nr:hypothetical protein [Planctomycetaceae bacterium]
MPLAGQVVDLQKHYDLGSVVVKALRGVSADFPQGDFVAIMGASGSGKSTLLNILGGLDRPTHGSYFLGGHDISKLTDDQLSVIRNKMIGFIFQSYNLIAQYTVLENIEVPLHYRHGYPRIGSRERNRCIDLAREVGLGDRLDHRPFQLSGGQQQRVAIARALVNDPQIILADEPTGNLDSSTEAEIMDVLSRLNAQGRTILMVTHEPNIAELARRTIVLKDGLIESDTLAGAPRRIVEPPAAVVTSQPAPPPSVELSNVAAEAAPQTAPATRVPGRLTIEPPKPTAASVESSSATTPPPQQPTAPEPGRLTITPSAAATPTAEPPKEQSISEAPPETRAPSTPAAGRITIDSPPEQAAQQRAVQTLAPTTGTPSLTSSISAEPVAPSPGRLTVTPPAAATTGSSPASTPTLKGSGQESDSNVAETKAASPSPAPGRLTVTPQPQTQAKPAEQTKPQQKTSGAKISASSELEKLINVPKKPEAPANAAQDVGDVTTGSVAQQPQPELEDRGTPAAPRETKPASPPPPRKRPTSSIPDAPPSQPPQPLEGDSDPKKQRITLTREQLESLLRQQQLMQEQKQQAPTKKPSQAFYQFLADQDAPDKS